MATATDSELSLEFTPTWVVALVCLIIVFISLFVERSLHHLGKFLKHKDQDALFEALQKLKEELMLLGFISLLLTVFQGLISHLCIPKSLTVHMLPCKKESSTSDLVIHNNEAFSPATMWHGRRLLSTGGGSDHCAKHGQAPLLSLEALHQLHIFIFVLALVHVIFCATTMFLGGLRIRQWKQWEDSIRHPQDSAKVNIERVDRHIQYFRQRATGFWRKSVVISWIMSLFKQFCGSVTKSDYIAMRSGFIMCHCPSNPDYNFHKYMMRTLETDFKKVVGISWYLWLFVVIFLLLNVEGWHTYFWMSFLPLILALVVGAKLEHIITQLAEEISENKPIDRATAATVKPSDKHFWFGRPGIVLYLIHFILFQNAFEIAFFFWIWTTYGFHSCILEKVGYIIPRLIVGVIVQVLCSYSTLPLYAIVTQLWHENTKRDRRSGVGSLHKKRSATEMQRMAVEAFQSVDTAESAPATLEGIITLITEVPDSNQTQSD
ncbi:Mlo-related protein [Macleaya cordata]|uniref:MLO-like protein n=1 Tax=Macleaya cordata TaxID=56857 RepID=A0A200QW85_MACCD|nr:Mlo-related protein [Macleaya cordata]